MLIKQIAAILLALDSILPEVRFSIRQAANGLLLQIQGSRAAVVPHLPYICATAAAILPIHSVQIGEDQPIMADAILRTWPREIPSFG